jgi:hypothetical protein
MADEARAPRLGAVIVLVRLAHGAEPLDPVLAVVEAVGVVHHVTHLVAQVDQDLASALSLDHAGAVGVELGQLGVGQVERDRHRHGLERDTPLGR